MDYSAIGKLPDNEFGAAVRWYNDLKAALDYEKFVITHKRCKLGLIVEQFGDERASLVKEVAELEEIIEKMHEG